MQEMAKHCKTKIAGLGTGVSELHLMQSKANSLTQTKLPTWRKLLANVQVLPSFIKSLFYICCFKQSPNHPKSNSTGNPSGTDRNHLENPLEIRPFCPCNASVVKQDAQVPTHQAITGFVMRPFFLAWQNRTWCAFWDHVSHVSPKLIKILRNPSDNRRG